MHFVHWSAWNSSQHYEAVLNFMVAVLVPSMRVLFTNTTYLCLCYIKVIALGRFKCMLFLVLPHICHRVLSCISVLHVFFHVN